jgi:hypothetical protein
MKVHLADGEAKALRYCIGLELVTIRDKAFELTAANCPHLRCVIDQPKECPDGVTDLLLMIQNGVADG